MSHHLSTDVPTTATAPTDVVPTRSNDELQTSSSQFSPPLCGLRHQSKRWCINSRVCGNRYYAYSDDPTESYCESCTPFNPPSPRTMSFFNESVVSASVPATLPSFTNKKRKRDDPHPYSRLVELRILIVDIKQKIAFALNETDALSLNAQLASYEKEDSELFEEVRHTVIMDDE